MRRRVRVAVQTYSDPLELADIDALKEQMDRGILPPAAEKVHIIADLRQVRSLPTTMLSRGSFMLNSLHPNSGVVVAVIDNNFVYRMARVFAGLVPRRAFQIVQSYDDAVAIIDEALAREGSHSAAG